MGGNMENDSSTLKNPFDETVQKLQKKFDAALDKRNISELRSTIDEAFIALKIKTLNSISVASLYYSIATAYSDLEMYSKEHQNEKNQERIIYYYRKSLELIQEYGELNPNDPYYFGFQLDLYTNYANSLNRIGRTIEALRYYQKALTINPEFGMALGNCGIAYMTYANKVYDRNHRNILHHYAYSHLSRALMNKEKLHSQAIDYFEYYLSSYNNDFKDNFLEKELKFNTFYIGESKDEIEYRKWVLEEHLYLNPLNDLQVTNSSMASDILHLPTMRMRVSNGINYKYHSMFNSLKQEYITSRFMYFECTQKTEDIHFADRNTHLIDTLDYTSHSIRLEKLKFAYRSLYSLFDKSSYFLNEYFSLGIKERDITFRSIWKSEKSGKNGYSYKNTLPYRENYALNANYWLFKDLFVKLYSSTSPHAKKHNKLRNALEHKFVKVQMADFYNTQTTSAEGGAYDVSEEALEKYTFDLLNITRELLIYLSLSVHSNEKKYLGDKEKLYMPVELYEIEDEWKF